LYGCLYYSYISPIYYIIDFWKVNRFLKSFCDYRLSATIGGRRLSSDYRLSNNFRIVSDYRLCRSWCLFGWLGGCCWLGIALQRVKGWRLPALIRPRWRLQALHFAFLVADAGGMTRKCPQRPLRGRTRRFFGLGISDVG